ncbi:MAG: hypothetical protein ACRDJ4_07300 [Actinomycetota bacterium]
MSFVGTAAARVIVRPRKIGYLVRQGGWADFDKAVAYASTEWGGQGQPIIPVRRRSTVPALWRALLENIRPEVLIDYAGVADELKDSLSAYGIQVLPETQLPHWEPGAHLLAGVPTGDVRGSTIVCAQPSASRLNRIAVGIRLPEHDELYQKQGCGLANPRDAAEVLLAQLTGSSLLSLSLRNCSFQTITGLTGGLLFLFLFERIRFDDAIQFWNIRACLPARSGNYALLGTFEAFNDQRVIGGFEHLVLEKINTRPDILLIGDDARLKSFTQAMNWSQERSNQFTTSFTTPKVPRDLNAQRPTFWLNWIPSDVVTAARAEGRHSILAMTISTPSTVVRVPSPVPFNTEFGGYVRFEIRDVEWWSWPQSPAIARLMHENAEPAASGFTLLTTPNTEYQFDVRVPDPTAALDALISEKGYTRALSDKGQYAAGLDAFIGDRARLVPLATEAAVRIVEALCAPNRKRFAQRIRSELGIKASLEKVVQRLQEVPFAEETWRTVEQLVSLTSFTRGSVTQALQSLVELGVARRAVSHRCNRCGLTEHVPLSRVSDPHTCMGCGLEQIAGGQIEPVFGFSLSPLADRAWDQGALHHLLVLHRFEHDHLIRIAYPGVNIVASSSESFELDVLALTPSSVVVGEVKARSNAFTKDEVRALRRHALKLGSDFVIVAAFDDWKDEARNRVAGLLGGLQHVIWGRRDILS